MSGLQLIATGGAIPGRTVTNEDLSRMVDTSDEWITSRPARQCPAGGNQLQTLHAFLVSPIWRYFL